MRKILNKEDDLKLKSQTKEQRNRFLSDLIKDKKAHSHTLEWAGFLALENQQWFTAETVFSVLLERRDKPLDMLGLAKALQMQGRLKESKECYLSALDKIKEPCPLLFIIYKALGDIYLLKNDFHQAEEYYNKAGTLNPHCPNLVFHRAMMYLKETNYIEAEKCFQNFLSSYSQSAKAWLGLALTRKALKDEELALACLHRVLDIEPQNARALKLKRKWVPSLPQNLSSCLSFSA